MTIKIVTAVCWLMALLHSYKGINDIILSNVEAQQNDEENHIIAEKFIPTTEWQVVKPNQAVPAGLHIRMNFQTGIKEAKFLEKEDQNGISTVKHKKKKTPKIIMSEESKPIDKFPQDSDKIYFTKNQLKDALHEFRDKVGNKDVDEITWSNDAKEAMEEEMAQESVKKKFRSIEEIKAELEKHMKIKVKSDVEIMKELIDDLTSPNSSTNLKGAALEHLEYYVHQIDNGKDLDKLGGLKPVILLLNSSLEEIQERAANVIGAAAQSNKDVQNAFLHYGGLRLLLQMLNPDKNSLTKKKGLFALSAVIRGNSDAQKELVKINGLESIMNIIKESSLMTSLRVKGVTLLFDLIVEQNEVVKKLRESGKMKLHERSHLLIALVESGWCQTLLPLLNTQDFDTKEKVLQAIRVSVEACNPVLNATEHKTELESELLRLEENIKTEDDNDFKSYLEGLRELLRRNILEKLYR